MATVGQGRRRRLVANSPHDNPTLSCGAQRIGGKGGPEGQEGPNEGSSRDLWELTIHSASLDELPLSALA